MNRVSRQQDTLWRYCTQHSCSETQQAIRFLTDYQSTLQLYLIS